MRFQNRKSNILKVQVQSFTFRRCQHFIQKVLFMFYLLISIPRDLMLEGKSDFYQGVRKVVSQSFGGKCIRVSES